MSGGLVSSQCHLAQPLPQGSQEPPSATGHYPDRGIMNRVHAGPAEPVPPCEDAQLTACIRRLPCYRRCCLPWLHFLLPRHANAAAPEPTKALRYTLRDVPPSAKGDLLDRSERVDRQPAHLRPDPLAAQVADHRDGRRRHRHRGGRQSAPADAVLGHGTGHGPVAVPVRQRRGRRVHRPRQARRARAADTGQPRGDSRDRGGRPRGACLGENNRRA